ncbi:MAG: asparagine synthase [Sphingobacteriaceae bacterium]|nr:MAG: asparagine synthase [Sphingobacteriaceae bacterium]
MVLSRVPLLVKSLVTFLNSRPGRIFLTKFLKATGVGSAEANIEGKLERVKTLLSLKDKDLIYENVMCVQQKNWLSEEDNRLLGSKSLVAKIKEWYPEYSWASLNNRSFVEKTAALDLITYLRDDVLVKVDRGTMAYSIEARSPLLDYRIVEFGTSLPLEYKLRGGIHKRILRDALAKRVQGEVLRLGKKGFGTPFMTELPEGRTMPARWNHFIEKQWREAFPKI